jgi:hypothetical protein
VKKKKVMIATNLYQVDPIVYSGHLQMLYRFGKEQDLEIIFHAPWRVPIDVARNNAAKFALYYECDYLFFYDDDMYFESGQDAVDLVKMAIENEDKIHILQGFAFIRGYPFRPMIFKLKTIAEGKKQMTPIDDWKEQIGEDGLIKCDAVGCCATVINTDLFKLTPEPWFQTGKTHTEDIYFCMKAQQYVKDLGIYCDPSKEIGHLLDKIILTKGNRDMLKEVYEKYKLNNVFLPDENFVDVMQQQAEMNAPINRKTHMNPLDENEVTFKFKEKEDASNL